MPTDQQKAIMSQWQALLVKAGYPLPKYGIDGLGGTETRDALLAFQKDRGLPQTGQLDLATRTALNPPPAPHVSSLEVAVVSAALSNLPFLPQPIKDALMFPTLLHTIVALLPQLPDDWSETAKDAGILASTSATAPDKLDAVADWATKLGQVLHDAATAARGSAATTATPATPASSK